MSACTPPCAQGQQCVQGACQAAPGADAPDGALNARSTGASGVDSSGSPDGSAARQEDLLALRTRTRLVLYVLGGLAEEDIGLVPAGSYAFEGGLGIGIRLNFSESFGFQTRLTGSFGPVGSGTYDGFKGYTSDATGTTVAAEAGLRFGPYGSKAPFYVGVNLGGLGRFVSGEVTCNGFNGADRCFRRVDSDVPAGDIVTVDETIFGGTAGADAGFVLGSDEAFDIGAGFRFFSDFDGYRYSLLLRFGWAVL